MYADYAISTFVIGVGVNDKNYTSIKSQMRGCRFQIRKVVQLAKQTLVEIHGLHCEVSGMTDVILAIRTSFLYGCLVGVMVQGHAYQH